jgi:hypothetical protein
MAKYNKTLFSKADLYHLADELISMYTRMKIILDLARMENNQVMIDAYSGIVFELELLIEAYGMKEMVKIN